MDVKYTIAVPGGSRHGFWTYFYHHQHLQPTPALLLFFHPSTPSPPARHSLLPPPPQFVPLEAETDSLSQATDQERRVSLPLPQEVSGDPQCNLILPTPSPAQGC